MPQGSTLTLNDGKSTPIAHAFEHARATADQSWWEDRSPSQYIGWWKIWHALVRPKGNSNVANRSLHSKHRIEIPVLETLGTADTGLLPAPTLAHRLSVDVDFTFSERSLEGDRKDLRVILIAYLQSAAGIAAIDKLAVST